MRASIFAAIILFASPAVLAQEQVKPIPQEPTAEERAAARKPDDKPGEPITAAEWARQERLKQGLPVAPAEEAKPVAEEPKPANLTMGFGSPAVDAPGGLASASAAPKHLFEISGYAILAGSFTQSDPQLVYV